jgi:hypothetical protein
MLRFLCCREQPAEGSAPGDGTVLQNPVCIKQDRLDVLGHVIHWKNNELRFDTFIVIPQTPLNRRENSDKNIGCYFDRRESVLNRGRR